MRKSLLTIDDSVDAIWLLPDPQVITPDNFYYITNLAQRMRLPVLASSERLVQAGALLSVSPDRKSVGQQAAKLALEMLNDSSAFGGQTFLPDLPRVTLNTTVQRKINWEIAPMAMSFVTQTVE